MVCSEWAFSESDSELPLSALSWTETVAVPAPSCLQRATGCGSTWEASAWSCHSALPLPPGLDKQALQLISAQTQGTISVSCSYCCIRTAGECPVCQEVPRVALFSGKMLSQ